MGVPGIGASQMTTKFLTIKFVKFPNFIVREFLRKNSVLGQFSAKFPLPNPLQNGNFINIVVSASLKEGGFQMVQRAAFSSRGNLLLQWNSYLKSTPRLLLRRRV